MVVPEKGAGTSLLGYAAMLGGTLAGACLLRAHFPPSARLERTAALLPTGAWVAVLAVSVCMILLDARRLTRQLHSPSAGDELVGDLGIFESDEARAFARARAIHERYMMRHELDLTRLTREQMDAARKDPQLTQAAQLYEQGLVFAVERHHGRNCALAHQQLGLVCLIRGQWSEARRHYAESLANFEGAPFADDEVRRNCSTNHYFLALLAYLERDDAGARAHLEIAAPINAALGDSQARAQDAELRALLDGRGDAP